MASSGQSVTICIPARKNSSRMKCKLLRDDTGMPLVLHTASAALKSELADRVFVITDSIDIVLAVDGRSNAEWHVYSKPVWCGTQRIARAIDQIPGEIVVNLQADEPLIVAADVDRLIAEVYRTGDIVTLVAPLSKMDAGDTNVVKCTLENGICTGFSRQAKPSSMHHVGVYGFTRSILVQLGELKQSRRSEKERLEQLAWMDKGFRIRAVKTETAPLAINTDKDYERFVRLACTACKVG